MKRMRVNLVIPVRVSVTLANPKYIPAISREIKSLLSSSAQWDHARIKINGPDEPGALSKVIRREMGVPGVIRNSTTTQKWCW